MDKILIIEDSHDLRHDIVDLLELEGYQVRGAENGRIGVELAREYLPALIICDIMMPELDGYGVLRTLQEDAATADIPLIFLTAKTEKTDMRHGMGLGADDYLTKPFDAQDLLRAVQTRLEKRATLAAQTEYRLEELRESIITALPHELRTPLNTIIGFSELLIDQGSDMPPDQVVSWGREINSAGLRLYRLVENYLAYARITTMIQSDQQKAISRSEELLDPATVIEFQAMHSAQAARRDYDLVLDVIENVPIRISERYLRKIVEELLDNAFKFSEPDTPVTLRTNRADTRYCLTIRDRGRGMTPEQIETIGAYIQFDRWFHEQQGMGLGLAIVSRLAELYEATMELRSVPAEGTSVSVNLRLVESPP